MRAERLSKVAIAAWAVIATFIEFYYASPGWAALRWIGPLLLVAAAAASSADRRAVASIAAAPLLFPFVLYVSTGEYHVHYSIAWLAAMLGFVLPDALTRPWHAPARWSAALACWAGVIGVTAPIVVLRSIDWRWDLLTRSRLPYEALGGLTFQRIGWIGHVSLLIVIGILWFDWLCSASERFFVRWVATPLAASAVVMALVGVYQMLVDIHFVNPTVYANLGRATATLFDANVAGAAAALWIGGATLFGLHVLGRRWPIVVPFVGLFWAAVWASGSRTAFASAAIVTLFAALAVLRTWQVRPRTVATVVALVVVLLGAGTFALAGAGGRVIGPLARFREMSGRGETATPSALVTTLWNRDGYGIAANRMIARYPAFGIGVASFNDMAPEFAGSLPADNAQNWYRHQLAETGLVGSLGWIVFVASFGWWVIRPHAGERPSAWAARGMLIALAIVSLVGVPGQDPAIAIMLWTVAAWYLLVAGRPRDNQAWPRPAWAAALVVVIAAGAGTARLAAGPLRLPVRIQHATTGDFTEYSYGFFPAETDDQGEFRWTGPRATTVVPATGRVLELTVGANHPDMAEHPTHAKAWVDGRLVIDGELTNEARAITKTVALPPGEQRALIETWADRVVTAPSPDGRELGLMVRWRFSQP